DEKFHRGATGGLAKVAQEVGARKTRDPRHRLERPRLAEALLQRADQPPHAQQRETPAWQAAAHSSTRGSSQPSARRASALNISGVHTGSNTSFTSARLTPGNA